MRVDNVNLLLGTSRLFNVGNSLQVKKQRMPVNQENDFQSHERVPYDKPSQTRIGQSSLAPRQSSRKNAMSTIMVIDLNRKPLTRHSKTELEAGIKIKNGDT